MYSGITGAGSGVGLGVGEISGAVRLGAGAGFCSVLPLSTVALHPQKIHTMKPIIKYFMSILSAQVRQNSSRFTLKVGKLNSVDGLLSFLVCLKTVMTDEQLEFARDELLRIHEIYRDELDRRRLMPSAQILLFRGGRESKE